MRQCFVAVGFVRDGKFHLSKREPFLKEFTRWPNCRVVLRVEEHRDPRSVALNAYWWGVVIHLVSETTGDTPEEAHELMKEVNIPKRFAALRGTGKIRGLKVFQGTTTDLSNDEEWELIENTQRWAATTIDCVIPDPQHV